MLLFVYVKYFAQTNSYDGLCHFEYNQISLSVFKPELHLIHRMKLFDFDMDISDQIPTEPTTL